MRQEKYIVSIVLIISFIFYFLNHYVPFFSDDLGWANTLRDLSLYDSLNCIYETQLNHWVTQNGRFTCHTVLQILAGNGEFVYDLGITLIFLLSIFAIEKIVCHKANILTICIIVIVLLYTSPDSSSIFYWAAGGCNYLLPLFLSCQFLLILRFGERKTFCKWQMPFLSLFSFFAGWSHEIFALPIAFAIFCSIIILYCRKDCKKISTQIMVLIAFYWLGTMMIIVSPGTINRIVGNSGVDSGSTLEIIMTRIVTSFKIIRYGRCFFLLLLLILFLLLSKKYSLRSFITDNCFLLLCCFTSLGIVIVLRVGGRAVWGVEVFSLMLILRWIDSIDFERKWRNVYERISFFIIVVVIGHQFLLISPFKDSWQTYRDVVAQTEKPSFNGTASMENWHSDKWWIEPFVAHPYDMMIEDMWMRIPLKTNVCRVDQYEYLKGEAVFHDSKMAENIGGDFYIPYSEDVERKILTGDFVMKLVPISYSSSESWLYLTWHQLLQKLWPLRYPESISSVYPTEISRIQVEDQVFIRFEKPVRPVYRQIMSVKIN